jgi:hypothetical protein
MAPVQSVEYQLVDLWGELLPNRRIGVCDSFFELGGDSLLAVEMIRRVETLTGMQVPLAMLLAGPTIEQLGKALVGQRFETASSLVVKVYSDGDRRPLFFCTET